MSATILARQPTAHFVCVSAILGFLRTLVCSGSLVAALHTGAQKIGACTIVEKYQQYQTSGTHTSRLGA